MAVGLEEAQRVRTGAGVFVLEDLGVLVVRGEDRVSWLNGMVSSDVTRAHCAVDPLTAPRCPKNNPDVAFHASTCQNVSTLGSSSSVMIGSAGISIVHCSGRPAMYPALTTTVNFLTLNKGF